MPFGLLLVSFGDSFADSSFGSLCESLADSTAEPLKEASSLMILPTTPSFPPMSVAVIEPTTSCLVGVGAFSGERTGRLSAIRIAAADAPITLKQ